MIARYGCRRLLALIAAYAVALQPMFAAALVLPALGSASAVEICTGGAPSADQPGGHDGICVMACAMANCAAAGCPAGPAAIATAQPVFAALVPVPDRSTPRPSVRGPQIPRGPPSV